MCKKHNSIKCVSHELTHLGLILFCRSPPGHIREIEGFATHICVTREMRAVFHDAYMRHQAKMSLKALKLYTMISWAGTASLIIGCHYIRSMINSFNWYLISVLNFLSNWGMICNITQRFTFDHTAHTVDITEHSTVITLFVNHTHSLSLYIYICSGYAH